MFHSPCCISTPSPAPAALALRIDFIGLLDADPFLQYEPVDDLPPATDPEPGVCFCVILQTGLVVKVRTYVRTGVPMLICV